MVITAANAKEKSKADIHDRDLGVYLSNAFARVFRRTVDATPTSPLRPLPKPLPCNQRVAREPLQPEPVWLGVQRDDERLL